MSDVDAPKVLSDAKTDFVESSKTGWEHSGGHTPGPIPQGKHPSGRGHKEMAGERASAPIKSRGTSGRSRPQGRNAGMPGTSPSEPKRRRDSSESSRQQGSNGGTTLYGKDGVIVSQHNLTLDTTAIWPQRHKGRNGNRTVRKPRPSGRRFVGIILAAALAAFGIGGVKRAVDEFNATPEFEVVTLTPSEHSDGKVPIQDQNGKLMCFAPKGSIATVIGETDGSSVKVKFADDKGNTCVGYVGTNFLGDRQVVDENPDELDVRVNKDGEYTLTGKADKNGRVKVLRINRDGEITQTTINESELSKPPESNPLVEEIMNKTQVNAGGNVTGIDVAFASGEQLKSILCNPNAIPGSVEGNGFEAVNTEDLAGRINYVWIQIGASSIGDEFRIIKNEYWEECANVCEALKVPYGLYYYSTSLDKREALEEARHIEAVVSKHKGPYNVLPVAVDREQGDVEGDGFSRLNANAITCEQNTELTKTIINDLEDYGINTILYTGSRDIAQNGERLIKPSWIKELNSEGRLWVAVARGSDGETVATFVNELLEGSPTIEQTVLNGKLGVDDRADGDAGADGGVGVDLNKISEEAFAKMVAEGALNNNHKIEQQHTVEAPKTPTNLDEGPDDR